MRKCKSRGSLICLLLLWILQVSVISAAARTVFVSANGANKSGLSAAEAWSPATFATKQLTSLYNGDTILFRRGDRFHLKIRVERSDLVYGAYGAGSKPVITGLKRLDQWVHDTGSVYYCDLDLQQLNLVVMDGKLTAMGRYPDFGYLTYASHKGNFSITGTRRPLPATNLAGSEVVIRKNRYIIDRHPITAVSKDTIRYALSERHGQSDLYEPGNGNGYFVQHHKSTLTRKGEWFFDSVARRLYMHFGSAAPASQKVSASTIDMNVQLNTQRNIHFNNIVFEGANEYGAWIIGTGGIVFTGCDFIRQGGDGLRASFINGISVQGCTITDCLNNGITILDDVQHIVVADTKVLNCGTIAGAGRSGDGQQTGISVSGNDILIRNSSVTNTGYSGISFMGSNVIIENNAISNFCLVKDDGAGIYTYGGKWKMQNRLIRNNKVTKAVGSYKGAGSYSWEPFGKAAGIYLDEFSSHTIVTGNTVSQGNWIGIFVNNVGAGNTISNNKVSGFPIQLHVAVFASDNTRSLAITGNELHVLTGQSALSFHFFNDEDIKQLGTFRRNRFTGAVGNRTILVDYKRSATRKFTIQEWTDLFENAR